jgi:hypothetical protein
LLSVGSAPQQSLYPTLRGWRSLALAPIITKAHLNWRGSEDGL